MQLTPKQLISFKDCKSPAEIISKGKELGISITEAQAKYYLDNFNCTELSEDDIDVVSGGCSSTVLRETQERYNGTPCTYCSGTNTVVTEVFDVAGLINIQCNDCQKTFGYKI